MHKWTKTCKTIRKHVKNGRKCVNMTKTKKKQKHEILTDSCENGCKHAKMDENVQKEWNVYNVQKRTKTCKNRQKTRKNRRNVKKRTKRAKQTKACKKRT